MPIVALPIDLDGVRSRTLALVADLADEHLVARLDPLMSPLVWDLGHIAAYEDLWLVHRHGGRRLLRPDLAAVYDAFETPRSVRGRTKILGPAEALHYLAEVRKRTLEVLDERGLHPGLYEMVLRHELQHTETMLQAMRLGGLAHPEPDPVDGTGLELTDFSGGAFAMGAETGAFAYDNERPRHLREMAPFRIARTPVTNATWLTFVDTGGYRRRDVWSSEGWAWRERGGIDDHAGARTGCAEAPVCHVSWFEAEAFCRAHSLRLPTELEWERAATSTDGDRIEGVGRVWEWSADHFAPYPGFVAHPYREYSEVFFGGGYRVLRGGSCATHPRVATPTFRNWDRPERRQLFAGLRVAADA